ncbi:pilus assembly protein PilM [Erwinia sp.]|uniref:pilus assembly protein PilM n=1 Tax=Erwinia citreus TaxID=558 RepID=UPI0028A07272|nr:pilus assembly protein PilM [Erwinia sp.]
MAFQTWQVGLDIQNGQLCALGIQYRRNGWQLRHWWQHALPHDTLTNGLVQRPTPLIPLLQQWRKRLPRQISLRVGFPARLALQHALPLPQTSLREPERSRYITAAAKRFFPIEPEKLALDYRQSATDGEQLWLTAARQDAVHVWLSGLNAAGLHPQVLELAPAALFALAQSLQLNREAVLVHRLPDHWLWFGTGLQPQWGWCPAHDATHLTMLREKYLADAGPFYYSSAFPEALPDDALWLDPLAAFAFKALPLPAYSGAFALAAGLALRPEDA